MPGASRRRGEKLLRRTAPKRNTKPSDFQRGSSNHEKKTVERKRARKSGTFYRRLHLSRVVYVSPGQRGGKVIKNGEEGGYGQRGKKESIPGYDFLPTPQTIQDLANRRPKEGEVPRELGGGVSVATQVNFSEEKPRASTFSGP